MTKNEIYFEKCNLSQLAFEESPAPLVVTQNRQILRCNKAFARLFGYSIKALEGEPLIKLYPSRADYYSIGKRCINALKSTKSYEDERFMQHRDGTVFWARARGKTLTPEEPFKLMVWNFERIRHKNEESIKLTPREQEIATYIVNGLTSKETAEVLGISNRTVEVHRSRIMKKLNAKNTNDLVSKIVMISYKDEYKK